MSIYAEDRPLKTLDELDKAWMRGTPHDDPNGMAFKSALATYWPMLRRLAKEALEYRDKDFNAAVAD